MLKKVLVLLWLCLFAFGCRSNDAASKPFSIILLPDTQDYVIKHLTDAEQARFIKGGTSKNADLNKPHPEIFTQQTQWIVDNKDKLNIAFVLHLGDVTQDNTPVEWQYADQSMSVLDGNVPYAMASGNHDLEGNGLTVNGTRNSLFSTYFPPSRFANLAGTFPAEPDISENAYHLFSAGGTDWLVMCLEFGARDTVLEWAKSVIEKYPDRRVIILTHTFLYWDGTHHSADDKSSIGGKYYSLKKLPGGANDADEVWEKLVKLYPNISFVFNGHTNGPTCDWIGDSAGAVSIGDNGNKVYQVLTNFQSLYGFFLREKSWGGTYTGPRSMTGGGGYLRIVKFYPAKKKVVFKTYSPYYNDYMTVPEHKIKFNKVELGPPAR